MASVAGTSVRAQLSEFGSGVRRRSGDVTEAMIGGLVRRLTAVLPLRTATPAPAISAGEVEAFARLSVSGDTRDLVAAAELTLARGVSVESVFVDLLAPAARRIGEAWTSDDLDFVDVTMALWRLQEALRDIAARTPAIARAGAGPQVALVSPWPGDQHAFGPAMVEECFSRAGWVTELLIEPDQSALLAAVAARAVDVVTLTVSNDCPTERLRSLVLAVRNVSRNPDLVILLGGRVLIEQPSLAIAAGADGTTSSAIDAVRLADRLVSARRLALAS